MTGWDLVKQRGFRHFFLADVISGFGVGLTTVGANWFMLQQTHANKLVGLYLTLNVLAGFLMSPIAGRLTDRFSRKSVILISFWGRLLPLVGVWGYFKLIGFNLGVMAILAIVTGLVG
ncbi:MFS transporter [Levilactobacillus brevis]|uniref:MFS transporter n=1 Tax=Levilactobacillus brevis TaxID=1580 RepID=UPI001BA76493|nr:MFS transporter [Levilactobacillus brevis]MBS1006598.1 MFS transporter [Levilactobacillus brevis]MBS1013618.1 MFS transporter [Levilactobacillus brevis]